MKIVNVKITELKPNKQNPRQIKEADYLRLKESIEKFGLLDPIIVNEHPKRKNVVIGGHQRLRVARDLGHTTVPVIYTALTLAMEKELNLRLNKNGGEWDKDALANYFDLEDLIYVGFKHTDLGLNIDKIDLPKEKPVDLSDIEEKEVCKCTRCEECAHNCSLCNI
jgi:ParB-like chromosome segregation protein Spo0J